MCCVGLLASQGRKGGVLRIEVVYAHVCGIGICCVCSMCVVIRGQSCYENTMCLCSMYVVIRGQSCYENTMCLCVGVVFQGLCVCF